MQFYRNELTLMVPISNEERKLTNEFKLIFNLIQLHEMHGVGRVKVKLYPFLTR